MSLRIALAWKAGIRTSSVRGFFLVPREIYNTPLSCRRIVFRRNASTESTSQEDSGVENSWDSLLSEATESDLLNSNHVGPANGQSEESSTTTNAPEKPQPRVLSRSAKRREEFRSASRSREMLALADPAVVAQPSPASTRERTHRNARRVFNDNARQAVYHFNRIMQEKPMISWVEIAEFMAKHTPQFKQTFNFKVVFRNKAAGLEAHRGLSTDLKEIQQRTQSVIRVDGSEPEPEDGSVVLSITGSEYSVRQALKLLTRDMGRLTALRALNSDAKAILRDLHPPRLGVQLSGEGSRVVGNDNTVFTAKADVFKGRQEYYPYMLTRRADAIERPSEWTTKSLEAYIASLVYGVIPRHLQSTLYPEGALAHQHHVASLLVDIFSSEEAKLWLSVSALDMALSFTQRWGLSLRPIARKIFNLAEARGLPMDTTTCNLLLKGCSDMKDLSGFYTVVKTMVRKGCRPDIQSWLHLLYLVESHDVKQRILRFMTNKGLDQHLSISFGVARHMAPYELEDTQYQDNIPQFLDEKDNKYGRRWFDVVTLNRMLDMLGERRRLDTCHELLDLYYESRRGRATCATLNTMLTHCRSIPQSIQTMRTLRNRWNIHLDNYTMAILFHIAWDGRHPNMLRLIVCYGGLLQILDYQIRHDLIRFLDSTPAQLGRKARLKDWEDTIMGKSTIVAVRGRPDGRTTSFTRWFTVQRKLWWPLVPFEDKLAEAYELDREVHRRYRDGEPLTDDVRDSLTVKIPLGPRWKQEHTSSGQSGNGLAQCVMW